VDSEPDEDGTVSDDDDDDDDNDDDNGIQSVHGFDDGSGTGQDGNQDATSSQSCNTGECSNAGS